MPELTAIRFTMFPPGGPPMTIAAMEDSFKDSVGDTQLPSEGPMFVIKDVFQVEVEDGEDPLPRATATAMIRSEERFERESNMAVMYHWTIGYSLRQAAEGGSIVQTERSPLTVDELRYCHEQIALHPTYRDQKLCSLAEDGTLVNYP